MRQPLAGEIAARRELLERMPFCTGYAVEIGLLLDVCARRRRRRRSRRSTSTSRQNRHRPLAELAPMAEAVLATVTSRLQRAGRLADAGALERPLERPPLAELRALRAAR